MYSTVKEYHIGIDLGLQDINANRKSNIKPEDKDWILNEVALQFINSRVNPKSNPKGEGFEQTQKRLDDLAPLKKLGIMRMFKDPYLENCVYSYLPRDYYMLINSRSKLIYNCHGISTTESTYTRRICPISFAKDIVTPYYSNFRITYNSTLIFNINDYNISILNNEESRFMYILLVLEVINKRTDLEVYWENYGNLYYQDSFIFVRTDSSGSIPLTMSITYDPAYSNIVNFEQVLYTVNLSTSPMIVTPNRVVQSDNLYVANSNTYTKTDYDSPICFIQGRFLKILHNGTFVPLYVDIDYYKLPRKISLALNQTFEIPERGEELVNLAVQKIKARINDENYKSIINENLMHE